MFLPCIYLVNYYLMLPPKVIFKNSQTERPYTVYDHPNIGPKSVVEEKVSNQHSSEGIPRRQMLAGIFLVESDSEEKCRRVYHQTKYARVKSRMHIQRCGVA